MAIVNFYRFEKFGKSLGEVLSIFFLTFEFNYIIIHTKLCRSVEQNAQLVAHVWSQLILLATRMTYP